MQPSKVYWSDFRATPGTNLLKKLNRLILTAGLSQMELDKRFVAIKIHFGEPGNLAYLRPNFAKVVVDAVAKKGGLPFLTDCNTLYVGRRKHALEHLDAAYENGFSPAACGCNLIIADGLKGTDDVAVPVKNGEYVTEAKIGRAVMDADVVISLNHFKGHESTGFGGALKNLGMGCGSRAGKMEQHCHGQPEVRQEKCVGCHLCEKICGQAAIRFSEGNKAAIDPAKCVGCGRCLGVCPHNAIYNPNFSANRDLNLRMAEYAQAVVQNRPHFHISLVMDVSPYCDCHAENDLPIIPDVGMFASFDPVALDQACADACNRMPVLAGSLLSERQESCDCDGHHDHFSTLSPDTDWSVCLDHAEKIGVGQRAYELIQL